MNCVLHHLTVSLFNRTSWLCCVPCLCLIVKFNKINYIVEQARSAFRYHCCIVAATSMVIITQYNG